eukprot:gnl/MRDRNA2_/MRDRNA2_57122_c0_seq1.p1 gnl/MRDRNA2_/MRDRNA2_57122_c0~~gnl/MRDRNA2_/MRDRNA2_57122_c0_seq1.p1  ORF type:complete len:446 (-),score=23.40 gnl/MRDRNA2_/MRDRNA2_57122_c0_seq1:56-1393(-)
MFLSCHRWTRLCVFISVCMLQLPGVGSYVMNGELPTDPFFAQYVGKFCFDYSANQSDIAGLISFSAKGAIARESHNEKAGRLYLMVFDDEKMHWRHAQESWKSTSCAEKHDAASFVARIDVNQSTPMDVSVVSLHEHLRPRFWYFTFVGCGVRISEPITFNIHVRNPLQGWQEEFGTDHHGLVMLHIVFVFCFSVVWLLCCCMMRSRQTSVCSENGSPEERHPYLRLLLLSHVASVASSVALAAHYITYAQNGVGLPQVRFLGVLASTLAVATVLLILMLAGRGWAITSFRIDKHRHFFVLLAALAGISAFCEIHSEVTTARSTKLYGYQSTPGVLALVFKVLMFCWFGFSIQRTIRIERNERIRWFYKTLWGSFSIWFLCTPVTVMVAYVVNPWWRYKVVTAMDLSSRLGGQVLLTVLFCTSVSPIGSFRTLQELKPFSESFQT